MHPHTHTSKQSKNQSILYLLKRPNNQDPIPLIDSWAKQISLEARRAQRATSLLVLGDNESSIWLNKTTHLFKKMWVSQILSCAHQAFLKCKRCLLISNSTRQHFDLPRNPENMHTDVLFCVSSNKGRAMARSIRNIIPMLIMVVRNLDFENDLPNHC